MSAIAVGPRHYRGALRLVIESVARERALLHRLALASLLRGLLALALPALAQMAMDRAVPEGSQSLLLSLSLATLLVCLHEAWFAWVHARASIALSAAVQQSALGRLIGHHLGSELLASRGRDAGWMMATLQGASEVLELAVESVSHVLVSLAFLLVYLAALSWVSLSVALVVSSIALLDCALSLVFERREARQRRHSVQAHSRKYELLRVLVGSLASVRGAFAERRLSARWASQVKQAARADAAVARVGVSAGLSEQLLRQLVSLGVLGWAAWECLYGSWSIGKLVFVTSVASGASRALVELSASAWAFVGLRPQLERASELLAQPLEGALVESGARPHGATWPDLEGELAEAPRGAGIEVEGVAFRYGEGGRFVLRDYDLKVSEGQHLLLRSPSGSGKTTLLRLVAGLITPTAGRVRVFGRDPSKDRSLVLYVPQQCQLFEATIRENLQLLCGAPFEVIEAVARHTGLLHWLDELPMRENTPVASEGRNLSSGQRQLILLTAALASTRRVLLFDEATSQLDERLRAAIDWPSLLAGRTVIEVRHD